MKARGFWSIALMILVTVCISANIANALDKTSTGFYYPIGEKNFNSANGWWLSKDPDYTDRRYHIGVDMMTYTNDPNDEASRVHAIHDGKVVLVRYNSKAWGPGNAAVLIEHQTKSERIVAVYGHIRPNPEIHRGKPVTAGQDIGYTGYWNKGIHLHFGIYIGDKEYPDTEHGYYGWGMVNVIYWNQRDGETGKKPFTNGFVDPIEFMEKIAPYNGPFPDEFGFSSWQAYLKVLDCIDMGRSCNYNDLKHVVDQSLIDDICNSSIPEDEKTEVISYLEEIWQGHCSTEKKKFSANCKPLVFPEITGSSNPDNDNITTYGAPDVNVKRCEVRHAGRGDFEHAIYLLPGERFDIETKVNNKGDRKAKKFTINYHRSGNKDFERSDKEVGDDKKISLDPGEAITEHKRGIKAPDDPGKYYIFIRLSKNKGDSKKSNDYSSNTNKAEYAVVYVEDPASINHLPKGYLDRADCDQIVGWAKDEDTSYAIYVHVYADGPAGGGGINIQALIADDYRSDVGSHGFSFDTPEILKDGYLHDIYVYAIDSDGGTNPLIGTGRIICIQGKNESLPIYRFCNLNTGYYIYTRWEQEKTNLLADLNWRYEGIVWYAYPDQLTETVPVYRFCNLQKGNYLYTRWEQEKTNLMADPNWRYEGIVWYAYSSQLDDSVPVYRFCNLNTGYYIYTRWEQERDNLMADPNWRYESIVWYALP
ncbi:MAG: peptidoglycan DD-metalloendopeptidase family protein [Candidatus Moranbacteria bacterium]|nr:peptidoglycan DD-metalloendopeptidase family protein [Candidatus Moranbacteria bacterium]